MATFLTNPFPLFIFFFLVSYPVSLFASSTNQIISCLTQYKINNFTTFPIRTNNSSTYYYHLLNFSIQNLRFTDSWVPKPLAIVLPKSVEEISNTVLCCRRLSLEIRVRCGGHSYEGTSAFASDGASFLIIDMINLNKVAVDLTSETAWVGGGATLGETYYAIAEASNVHGFSAGSCPTVGVGGHIGGGGFGLLSRKYGVAADHVVDALLVDANGRLLNREGMGEDVFWAIRGGGGGVWGIVYAWKIKLIKVPKIVTSFIISRQGTKSHVENLVNKWQHIAPNLIDDFYITCFVGAGLPEAEKIGEISATFKGFYLGPRNEALSIVKQAFPDVQLGEEDCKEMSWIESILFFSGLSKGSSILDLKNRYLQDKNYFKAKSDYVKTPISASGISSLVESLENEAKGYVILDPYGGTMERISGEDIPFPHRKGNLFTIQYLVAWYEEDNDKSKKYIEWIRDLYGKMTEFVSWGPRCAYINYMDIDLGEMELINSSDQNEDAVEIARVWGEKYFLKNYDRLVKAKTIIDPNNVFTNQQGIPPMSNHFVRIKSEE
ncbi:reticuline oxidase-like [Mangifera indica]|uniref:reticuline oxidase-like n=1 Tax=Mangifera indica TaxID=29780 RepID=UPI001CFAEF3E|nr:reticuline oxidase-like [Mangifera indica]